MVGIHFIVYVCVRVCMCFGKSRSFWPWSKISFQNCKDCSCNQVLDGEAVGPSALAHALGSLGSLGFCN